MARGTNAEAGDGINICSPTTMKTTTWRANASSSRCAWVAIMKEERRLTGVACVGYCSGGAAEAG
jgi:hypothetical protein